MEQTYQTSTYCKRQQGKCMLNDKAYQPLGVEDELVTGSVLVPYECVEASDLWRGRQQVEGTGSCHAKVCVG